MVQRKEMRKGFEEAGANAALRVKMTVILNDANRVSYCLSNFLVTMITKLF